MSRFLLSASPFPVPSPSPPSAFFLPFFLFFLPQRSPPSNHCMSPPHLNLPRARQSPEHLACSWLMRKLRPEKRSDLPKPKCQSQGLKLSLDGALSPRPPSPPPRLSAHCIPSVLYPSSFLPPRLFSPRRLAVLLDVVIPICVSSSGSLNFSLLSLCTPLDHRGAAPLPPRDSLERGWAVGPCPRRWDLTGRGSNQLCS